MHVFSQTQMLAWITALFVIEVLHLKWIWLTEWSCRRCHSRNLECECPGRWARYL